MTTISCFVWNAQSLNNKVDEVTQFLLDRQVDIACISETWLSGESSVTTFAIKEAGYQIDHSFRSKRGGGVAILWKPQFKVKCNLKNKIYESLQYKNVLLEGNVRINLICIYRFQEISTSQFLQDINDLLYIQSSIGDTIVVCGDFNFHYEKSDSKNVEDLSDLLSSYGLFQFVVGPSHKLGHTLDLVFANRHELDLPLMYPVDFEMSDHFPILFRIPSFKHKSVPLSKQISYRNLKAVNRVDFAEKLTSSLNNQTQSTDVNNLNFSGFYNLFSECVVSELDKVAPVKTKTISSAQQPPWMDAEYRSERAIRRRLERAWNVSSDPLDKALYVTQRKLCSELVISKRSQYFSNIISKCEGDQRALFKVVSTVMDKRKSSGVLPHFENPKLLANKFNNFYSNKVKQIRNNIVPPKSVPGYRRNFNGVTMESIMPTTVEELRKVITKMGIKTSAQDPLPGSIFKDVLEDLLPYLCKLVNKSFSTGSVDGIKDCVIIPLLKKSGIDPEELKNYRPVTNEVFISKLCETVVNIRLHGHMSSNSLHSRYQHAYKPFHGTETLLLTVVNDLLIGFDSDKATIVLLIDLSAAFDTVDIDMLLDILEKDIGIVGTALQWFRSFLVGRSQCVKIENSLSDTLPVLFGVPQGSVLGPVLFNIYASSLSPVIRNFGFNTSGYADDNTAYKSFALTFQYNMVTKQLPDLLDQIKLWMDSFFLKMNPDKTEIILLLPPRFKNVHTINGCIFSDGTCVRFSNFVKTLGFIIDKYVNMDLHVNSVVSHCFKLLGDIRKIKHLLSKKHTIMLVHAVVNSRLDYCNSLLYGVNAGLIDKLQKVQNAAARLISNRGKFEPISDVLVQLHWLRVEERIIFKVLVLIYKCVNGVAPESLINLIDVRDAEHCLLVYKYYLSVHARRSFSYIAPRLWNNLPVSIRLSTSVSQFKNQTKYLLFNNFNDYKKSVFKYNS